jgi:hypothetical protein
MVGGIALLRLGAMGGAFSKPLAKIVPRWGSLLVVVGFVIAISLLGYLLLGLIMASLFVLLSRFNRRSFLRVAVTGVAAVVPVWLLLLLLGTEFTSKLATIPHIFTEVTAVTGETPTVEQESFSALALASNLSVAFENIKNSPLLGVGFGGHPLAYDLLAPRWAVMNLEGLNKENAGSVLVRLLSETGAVGTILFLAGGLTVAVQARRAIRSALDYHRRNRLQPSMLLALGIGITASYVAIFIVSLLRGGGYFDPHLWLLIALTVGVSTLLDRAYMHTETIYPHTKGVTRSRLGPGSS